MRLFFLYFLLKTQNEHYLVGPSAGALFDPQHLPKAGRQKAQFNSSVPSAEELVCTEKITPCEKKE